MAQELLTLMSEYSQKKVSLHAASTTKKKLLNDGVEET